MYYYIGLSTSVNVFISCRCIITISINPYSTTQVLLSLLTPMELATIGVGQGGGLDREVRAYYTWKQHIIITNPDLVSYASVSVAARLAQLVEHQTFNLRVKGSSPLSGELLF